MMKRILALLCALLLALPLAAGAEVALPENLPSLMGAGGEWYVIALAQTGNNDLSACRTALLDYLDSHTVRAASTRQKLALTLLALGGEHAFIESTLADSIGKQGLMSWVWGLHLLNNGCVSPAYTVEDCIQTLLNLRKEDGGWAVTGTRSDTDATAMTLQALAPYRNQAEVADAIETALKVLSNMQNEHGGFSSFGVENAESAAQVIIALCALGIDPAAGAQFTKNGVTVLEALQSYRLADGAFAHELGGEASESAKAQAFLALAAYERYKDGKPSIFLLDGDEEAPAAKGQLGYKPIALAVIGSVALVFCLVLLLTGKRHPKNFLAVVIAAAALMALVLTVDIQSAGDYYAPATEKKDVIGHVMLTIRCDQVAGKAAHIPASGVILAETTLPIAAGDTVYTVLTDAARAHGIHMESSGANRLMYIHGIGNIYEFDYGDLSGWVYLVNGESASVGCDQYVLADGDKVEFHYTLELGRDIECIGGQTKSD